MDIVPSVSIANVINQRDGLVSRLTTILNNLADAQKTAKECGLRFPCFSVVASDYARYNSNPYLLTGSMPVNDHGPIVSKLTQYIDASAWEHLMLTSGIFSLLDAQARKKWRDHIATCDVVPLSADSIRSTFGDLYASRGEMFERGVIDCYRALSWHYKSNSPVKFGKRIVVHLGPVSQYPAQRGCDALDDLTRVFCALDKRPEPDHRIAIYQIAMIAYRAKSPIFETDFLSVRRYQNGNAHVTFKRADLVDALNTVLANHYPNALPNDSRRR